MRNSPSDQRASARFWVVLAIALSIFYVNTADSSQPFSGLSVNDNAKLKDLDELGTTPLRPSNQGGEYEESKSEKFDVFNLVAPKIPSFKKSSSETQPALEPQNPTIVTITKPKPMPMPVPTPIPIVKKPPPPIPILPPNPLLKKPPPPNPILSPNPILKKPPLPKPIHPPKPKPIVPPIPFLKPKPVPIPFLKPKPMPIPFLKPKPVPIPFLNPKPVPIPFLNPKPVPIPVGRKPVPIPIGKDKRATTTIVKKAPVPPSPTG